MSFSAVEWIRYLNLAQHPEGGWYREVYRSRQTVVLNDNPQKQRAAGTSIYYLLEDKDFSAFHRLKSDEIWHFYMGSPLDLFFLSESQDECGHVILGQNLDSGHHLQYTIPAGTWFAARVSSSGSYSLIGCTVAPGFEFEDFEIAGRETLLSRFKKNRKIILELTRT